MPTTHVDLASAEPWRRSLHRSQERRAATRRRLRRRFRRRGVSVALTVAMTAFAGAALAAGDGGAPSPVAVLSSGARGSEVAAVQAALGVPADGVFGPQTRRAVRAFQAAHGLAVDGVVGPQTRAALGLSSTPPSMSDAEAPASGDASTLESIAQCESSGDPSAVSGDGRYRGKYQFDRATWRELGGTGDPAAAPEAEQDRMAAKLMARQGSSAWPNCA